MKTLVAMIFVSALSAAYCQTVPKTEPFTLAISAERAEVRPGMQILIAIRITNFSGANLDCTQAPGNGVDKAYRYKMWDELGKLLPKRARKHPEIGDEFEVRPPCFLKPGATAISSADIGRLYDLTAPGRYTVQVSRPASHQNPKSGMIYSNKIIITVLPKPEDVEPQ